MSDKEIKQKKTRSPGAGRKPKPALSDEVIDTAKKIIAIIAPHLPVAKLDPMILAEAVINYGYEQALILQNNIDILKSQRNILNE
jgi:hypothetical protein